MSINDKLKQIQSELDELRIEKIEMGHRHHAEMTTVEVKITTAENRMSSLISMLP